MKSVLSGALTFFLIPTTINLLLTLASLRGRTSGDESAADRFFFAGYLILFAMAFLTVGFLIPTMAAPAWRRLKPMRAALIAGVLSFSCPLVYLVGLGFGAKALLPLFRSVPWLATSLTYMTPGVLAGLLGVLVAKVAHGRAAETVPTGARTPGGRAEPTGNADGASSRGQTNL